MRRLKKRERGGGKSRFWEVGEILLTIGKLKIDLIGGILKG